MNETILRGNTQIYPASAYTQTTQIHPVPMPRLRMQIPLTPRRNSAPNIPPEISIRDNSKILQLADRIQTKKSPTKHKSTDQQHQLQQLLTPTPTKPNIKNAKITVFGDSGKSKRKSKIYSSFTGKKFDPTRTNIEHLVNIRSPGPSPSPVEGMTTVTPSFHNAPKLVSAFGPSARNGVKNGTNTNTNPNRVTVTVNVHERTDLPREDAWETNQNGGGQENQDGVIIVDDLRNCSDILRRLSVNVVGDSNSERQHGNGRLSVNVVGDSNSEREHANGQLSKNVVGDSNSGREHGYAQLSKNLNGRHVTIVNCTKSPLVKLGRSNGVSGNNKYAPNGKRQQNIQFSSHYYDQELESLVEPKLAQTTVQRTSLGLPVKCPNICSAQIVPLTRQCSYPPRTTLQSSTTTTKPQADGSVERMKQESQSYVKNSHDYHRNHISSVRKSKSELQLLQVNSTCISTLSPEDQPYVERKRRNSFPTERKNSQNVLPSLLPPDELERLENRRSSFFQSTDGLSPSRTAFQTNKIRHPGGGPRPMSMDASHKKAWMKVYRDIEVSSAQESANRLDQTIKSPDRPEPKTLFQRFSKTFSLRFSSVKKKPSIPDIREKIERTHPSKPQISRTDKCSSGDSGIQLMDEPPMRRDQGFRRRATEPPSDLSLSLVEFPNHVWDEADSKPAATNAQINAHDDGFASTDNLVQVPEHSPTIVPSTTNNYANYHSLPLKYSRQRKAALLEKHLQIDAEPIRAKVIREIVTTEQSYVKTLHDIIQGFVLPCRNEETLFPEQVITSIFSNIEDLFRFHIKFLDNLMDSIDHTDWSSSKVGSVFTIWVAEFDLYSDYCISNPMSMVTVRRLMQNSLYDRFFEACRRLQLMDKLPLHGFLLRPIQRICQYHLQLNELLKNTEENHPDYESVVSALNAMKTVAMRVNDTQREFERLQEIVRFQSRIEGFEGTDLVNRNAVMLKSGDLVKMCEGERHREVHVTLLNRDIVICKRDSFRKNVLSHSLRIDLDSSVWVNIDSNEEDDYFGMVHNSWRIYNPSRSNWVLFTCASPTEKRSWMNALEGTSKKYSFDARTVEMAKITAELTESKEVAAIVRGKKMRKSNSKLDSDAMLIEVGKLKRPLAGSSKFYV